MFASGFLHCCCFYVARTSENRACNTLGLRHEGCLFSGNDDDVYVFRGCWQFIAAVLSDPTKSFMYHQEGIEMPFSTRIARERFSAGASMP